MLPDAMASMSGLPKGDAARAKPGPGQLEGHPGRRGARVQRVRVAVVLGRGDGSGLRAEDVGHVARERVAADGRGVERGDGGPVAVLLVDRVVLVGGDGDHLGGLGRRRVHGLLVRAHGPALRRWAAAAAPAARAASAARAVAATAVRRRAARAVVGAAAGRRRARRARRVVLLQAPAALVHLQTARHVVCQKPPRRGGAVGTGAGQPWGRGPVKNREAARCAPVGT